MGYDYEKQIKEIVKYLEDREKDVMDYKVGVEFEHFIVDSDTLESISYYHEDGVEDTLKEFEKRGWTGDYEGEYILGVHKGNKVITLEPGSQFEFSVNAQADLKCIEKEYQEFITEIKDILDAKNQSLVAVGYHPVTKIDDIKLLPKKRYDYMFNYFKDKGSHAHNMMKGTSALQVSLDYKDEEDYRKKYRIANAMSPIFYGLCDNSYYFENQVFDEHGLRTKIWNNMDDDRSGIVPGSLDDDFSYRKYAEYILNVPPIFIMEDGEAIPTNGKKMKELFNPVDYKVDELEHMMTMVFPDVRTKGFIEIRMMDSIPYPLNFGIIGLLVGIFYDNDNVNEVYELLKDGNYENIERAKKDIIKNGVKGKYMDKPIIEWGLELIDIARCGLDEEDGRYLDILEELLLNGHTPYELIRLKADRGRKESLDHCILDEFEVI